MDQLIVNVLNDVAAFDGVVAGAVGAWAVEAGEERHRVAPLVYATRMVIQSPPIECGSMGEWFAKSFAADPAGWISVGVAVAVIIFSAVFWRRTWAVLKAIGRGLRLTVRAIARIRVTTVSNLKPKDVLVIPPRWSVTRMKNRTDEHEFVLANWSNGSIARNVRLDAGRGADLRSAAVWPQIDGPGTGAFIMMLREDALWLGVDFAVTWYDERGERHWEQISIGGR